MMKTICLQAQVSRERDKIHLKGEVIMEAPSEELTLELLTEVRFTKILIHCHSYGAFRQVPYGTLKLRK